MLTMLGPERSCRAPGMGLGQSSARYGDPYLADEMSGGIGGLVFRDLCGPRKAALDSAGHRRGTPSRIGTPMRGDPGRHICRPAQISVRLPAGICARENTCFSGLIVCSGRTVRAGAFGIRKAARSHPAEPDGRPTTQVD